MNENCDNRDQDHKKSNISCIRTISWFLDIFFSEGIIDDRSRFITGCDYYDNVPSTDDVIKLIKKAIKIYGKTREILTDHGAQFYANKGDGVSSFDLCLDEKRIKHILAGVRKPTTISKVERWHRTMKDELISRVKGLTSPVITQQALFLKKLFIVT